MKKLIYLIALISLFSCGNKTNTSYPYNEDSLFIDSIEALETNNKIKEFEFSSYLIMGDDDIRVDTIRKNIKLSISDTKGSLRLYNFNTEKWMTIDLIISGSKSVINSSKSEEFITYYLEDEKNDYINIFYNHTTNGIYVEVIGFYYKGERYSCWMSKGEGIDEDYIERMYGKGTYVGTNVNTDIGSDNDLSSDVYQYSTSTTYTSNSYNSPSISSGSIDSEERNTNNHSRYSNYEETDRCVDGVVVYEGDDDFYIVENRNGYTVLERYFGTLYEGQRVRGELNKYGFTYLLKNSNYDDEVKVHIEDYMLTKNKAIEWLGEKKHLKSDDQRDYDTYN